jgi:hypothetical protein
MGAAWHRSFGSFPKMNARAILGPFLMMIFVSVSTHF